MKWLILLLIILAVAALIAARYRKQILTAWRLWKMYQQMRSIGKPTEKQINRNKTAREETNNTELVRCSRCNKWIPASQALNMRGKNFYCSKQCLEKAVKIASLVD